MAATKTKPKKKPASKAAARPIKAKAQTPAAKPAAAAKARPAAKKPAKAKATGQSHTPTAQLLVYIFTILSLLFLGVTFYAYT
jgi:hypothetical protein